MVNLTELTENLNKTELEALKKAKENKTGSFSELKEKLKEFDRNTLNKIQRILRIKKDKNQKKKDIDRTEEYFDFKEGKKDESYNVMEAAKGGEVKKYMGGGSVHKNKNKMITKRGWGASRKT